MRLPSFVVPLSTVPVIFNLYVSIPTMFITWLFVKVSSYIELEISKFTLILCISILTHHFILKQFESEEVVLYTERVGQGLLASKLQTYFGNFITFHLLMRMNVLLALAIFLPLYSISEIQYGFQTLGCLFLILILMLDPIVAVIVQIKGELVESIGSVLVSSLAYMAVILLAIGAIPADKISHDLYPYVICFGLISARLAFLTNFAFRKKQDLVVFAPSILAIFVAVLPNLQKILVEF